MAQDACSAAAAWPLWEQFTQRFMQDDGRVIDYTTAQQHPPKGRSYRHVLRSLVARDRARFGQALGLEHHQPGGRRHRRARPPGSGGARRMGAGAWWTPTRLGRQSLVRLRPGRGRPRLARTAPPPPRVSRTLLARSPSGGGRSARPGPHAAARIQGFEASRPRQPHLAAQPQLPCPYRCCAHSRKSTPGAVEGRRHQLPARARRHHTQGFAADWVAYQVPEGATRGAFVADSEKGDIGSFDAIRTYLWAGMTPRNDAPSRRAAPPPGRHGPALRTAAVPPEKVQTVTGQTDGQGPCGLFRRSAAPPARWAPQPRSRRSKSAYAPNCWRRRLAASHPITTRSWASLARAGWINATNSCLPAGSNYAGKRHVRKEAPPPKHPDSGLVASPSGLAVPPRPRTPPPRH